MSSDALSTVVGYCRPIVDRTIITSAELAREVLQRCGLDDGVSFADDVALDAVIEAFAEAGASDPATSPGGPVSNALHALASALGPYPRPVIPLWSGPVTQSVGRDFDNPLPALRAVGVRTLVQPSASTGLPQSVCVVERGSGDTLAIIVGSRDAMDIVDPPAADHVALVALYDLAAVARTSPTARAFAVMTADVHTLDAQTRQTVSALIAEGRLRWLFGTATELRALGWVIGEALDPTLSTVEVIATDGPRPVTVWPVGETVGGSHVVTPLEDTTGGFLGAGDAYSGTYLAGRLRGDEIAKSHDDAVAAAREASYHHRARVSHETNLTELFGHHIERWSEGSDWQLAQTVRHSAGTTIIGCLNTGVDEIARHTAHRWGLAYFGIMPRGRRRDGDPPPDDTDIIELDSPSYRFTTWANVFLSDGTLLVAPVDSEGSAETRKAAETLNRALEVIDLAESPGAIFDRAAAWAARHDIRIVNVAGNRDHLLDDDLRARARLAIDAAIRGVASRDTVRERPAEPAGVVAEPRAAPLGIPRLPEVSAAVRDAAGALGLCSSDSTADGMLVWTIGGERVIRGKSRDLVRAVADGELSAALVGLDMVLDMPEHPVSVVAMSGLFNSAIAQVGPLEPRAESGVVATQYPGVARRAVNSAHHRIVSLSGAAEGWVAAGIYDSAVDTWRTGRTARRHGLDWWGGVASCPLSLIVAHGAGVPALALTLFDALTTIRRA